MAKRNAIGWVLMVSLTAFAAAGCGKSEISNAGTTLPAGLMLAAAPGEPRDVKPLKSEASEGDAVIVRGRIGGRVEPFVEGRAMFLIADMNLPPCQAEGDDACCTTPWDYCCEPKEAITANTATVQIVDGEGRPLKFDVNGVSGLKPMATVVVTGKIAKRDGEAALVINAEGIYIEG